MTFTDFIHDSRAMSLDWKSSTEDVIGALDLVKELPHWMDRARAIDLLANRTGIDCEHLYRVIGEVWKR